MRQKKSKDLVRTSASISRELLERIQKKADAERRSLSSVIAILLEQALEKGGK